MKKLTVLLLAASLIVTGCKPGGDDDDEDDSFDYGPINEATIGSYLETTNLRTNSESGIWFKADSQTRDATALRIKHWPVSSTNLIPVKLNDVPFAADALNHIEQKLGLTLFDRTSLEGTPNDQVTRGIVFSANTASGPDGSPSPQACGMVGQAPNSQFPQEIARNFYDASGEIGSKVLWVHLGPLPGGGADCNFGLGISVHEVMHALGMGNHFHAFGQGGRGLDHTNDVAYTVLHNIYVHAPLTRQEDLQLGFPFGYRN